MRTGFDTETGREQRWKQVASQLSKQTARGARIAKPPILKIYGIQCVILLVFCSGLWIVNLTVAYSALLGGLISIGPNIYFACSAFRYAGARAAQDIARSMYRGEVLKFMLSAALFAMVFVLVRPLAAGTLFAAFILTTVVNTILVVKLGKI